MYKLYLKKKFLKSTLLWFCLVSSGLYANAQGSGQIVGKLITEDKRPLSSATVSIISAGDSAVILSTVTDTLGQYFIKLTTAGNYLLRISMVGYDKKYVGPFYFPGNATITEPEQILKSSSSNLSAVTITAQKSIVENQQGKTVYNVESAITSTGSTALEILQKTSGLQVDNSNNFSLKGKNGVRIYVNGREMPLDNNSLVSYLRTINSNDIKSIEVIENPNAGYDAAGSGGIINIRLKKNQKYGTNGDISLGYIQGITPKGNAALNLNYRNRKINIFGTLSGTLGKSQTQFNLRREQLDTLYDQRTLIDNYNNGFNVKAGLDYYINDKNIVGAMATYGYTNALYSSVGNTPIYSDAGAVLVHNVKSIDHAPGSNINDNFNINYRYADTLGTEINFDANYGFFKHNSNGYLPNYYYDNNGNYLSDVVNWNYGLTDIDIYTAKLDFAHNLWKGKLNYGFKFSSITTDNIYNFFDADQNAQPVEALDQSSEFNYKENIKAAYINYNHSITKNWTVSAGLRFEQTYSKGELFKADSIGNNTITSRNYDGFFPGITVSWDASKNHNFSLSYNRRIDRPVYQDLNPFELKLDEFTYFKGNSFLQPQYTNKVSLTDRICKKINASLFYSSTTNYAIQGSDTVKNEIYAQVRNIGIQRIIGVDLNASIKIANWWDSYQDFWYNFQMFDVIVDRIKLNTNISVFGINTTQSFGFSHGYSAELTGWLNSPGRVGIVWKVKPMSGVDIGFKKTLVNNSLSIKLSATDIFHTNKWTPHGYFSGVTTVGSLIPETRTVRLNISWRFGSNQIKVARERQTGAENESERIKK